MKPTTELHSTKPELGRSFADVLAHSSGSAAGYSANSEWLSCPEKSRLRSLGIKFRGYEGAGHKTELTALEFGTLIHELLAMRVWYGHDVAVQQLDNWLHEIGDSHLKAALMLGTYEQVFPYVSEPLTFLGIESEVVTDIKMGVNDPRPCFRSVRYDGVVYASGSPGAEPQLYSLERKTMSRGGQSALHAYYAQGMVQMGLWNGNAALVAKYGKMQGVIYEMLVKTKMPSVDRVPVYFSPEQQRLALAYMRLSENGGVTFVKQADGSYPKLLSSCWGRFSPCDFINLCHEGVTGDYLQDGEELEAIP